MRLIEKKRQPLASGFLSTKAAFGEPAPRQTAKGDKPKAAPECDETTEEMIAALPEAMLDMLDELFEDAAVLTGVLHDRRRERMAQCFDALRAGSKLTKSLMEHAADGAF